MSRGCLGPQRRKGEFLGLHTGEGWSGIDLFVKLKTPNDLLVNWRILVRVKTVSRFACEKETMRNFTQLNQETSSPGVFIFFKRGLASLRIKLTNSQ